MNLWKGPHFEGRKADKMVGTTVQIISCFKFPLHSRPKIFLNIQNIEERKDINKCIVKQEKPTMSQSEPPIV